MLIVHSFPHMVYTPLNLFVLLEKHLMFEIKSCIHAYQSLARETAINIDFSGIIFSETYLCKMKNCYFVAYK